jgi:hypothetical protein
MALTSSSTLNDAIDQAMNNLAWEGDVTKARDYLEACRAIRILRAQGITTTNQTINFEQLLSDVRRAADFVNEVSTDIDRAAFTRGVMLR